MPPLCCCVVVFCVVFVSFIDVVVVIVVVNLDRCALYIAEHISVVSVVAFALSRL